MHRRDALRWLRVALLAAPLLLLVACGGAPRGVRYDDGRCFKDGRPLTMQEVEDEQAHVASHIASRQPWFAVITIGVVLIAAAGNAEKALMLVRGKHEPGHRPLLERVRDFLTRQRDVPGLRAAVVVGSLGLIVAAGGTYVYLDIDKRASERELAALQFCHLALRTQDEQRVLDDQRKNLDAIESTAGDIRTLVGKLPPDEQRKAQTIVAQMNDALSKQGRLVSDYASKTDLAQKDLTAHTAAMEKGLASVQGDLAELRTMPTNLKDLESAAHRIDATTTAFDARFDALTAKIADLSSKVDALAARPACPAPAPASSPKATASGSPSPSSSAGPSADTPASADTTSASVAPALAKPASSDAGAPATAKR